MSKLTAEQLISLIEHLSSNVLDDNTNPELISLEPKVVSALVQDLVNSVTIANLIYCLIQYYHGFPLVEKDLEEVERFLAVYLPVIS